MMYFNSVFSLNENASQNPPHFPLYYFRKEVDKNEETIKGILKGAAERVKYIIDYGLNHGLSY